MSTDPDPDLRRAFYDLRREDRGHLPAFQMPHVPPARRARDHRGPAWLMAAASATACLALLWVAVQSSRPPRLVDALPPFFATPGAPLFAGLDEPPTALSDSDFLLPLHLKVRMP